MERTYKKITQDETDYCEETQTTTEKEQYTKEELEKRKIVWQARIDEIDVALAVFK